jgi:hypothetical protein
MMNLFCRNSVLVLLLLLFGTTCSADHLPPELQARGRPEKKLARIHLEHTKLADVIRMYGKPSKVEKQPSPPDLVMTDYYWNLSKGRLHLLMVQNYISLVEVEGSSKSGRLQTGSGLKIGDDLDDLKRIYGPRYKVRNIPSLAIHDVMIQWRSQEFSLVAELDTRDRIKKLSLFSPE